MTQLEAAAMRRGELRVEAEIRWHDEFAAILAELPHDGDDAGRRDQEGQENAND